MSTVRHSEPLIRLVKRDGISRPKSWGIRIAAVLLALLLSGLFIYSVTSLNPVDVYKAMYEGALGTNRRCWITIRDAMVLLCISVGLAPAFKMRFWNIGAEGQILVGGICTAGLMIHLGYTFSTPVLLCLMALASIAAGAVWGLIPAIFKARWGTNETLFTLMMNYIMIGIVRWLQGGPWEGRPGSQIIPQFDSAACLPKVFGVHCGWIIVLILVVFIYIYMRYTKHGYEIAVIGDSVNTARYAGMNVGRVIMRTMFLSGAISGLVGFIVASGADNTLHDGVAAGVGFTAITVAWLAQLNPFAMIAISGMLAILSKGADTLHTRMDVPASISDIITGMLLFCMLGCEFFINYRLIFRGGKSSPEAPDGKEAVKHA